jgi:hypothetical protein
VARTYESAAPTVTSHVEVSGVVQCVASFMCTWGARDIFVKGVEDGRPGSLLTANHRLVAEHSEMFAPLTLTLMAELDG